MKKMLTLFLTLAFLLCCSVTPASAKSFDDDSVAIPLVDTSYQCFTCPRCNGEATQQKTWVEYSYYYVILWATMCCDNCGYTWNTVVGEVANTWYAVKPDTENC